MFTADSLEMKMMRPQFAAFMPRQVMPAQAHPAHKVCLDDGVPVVVGDFLERLRLVHAKIVDENIY